MDTVSAVQIEDERLDAELAHLASGAEPFGIGSPGRLVGLHQGVLSDVRWRVSAPQVIRHMGRLVLAEEEPAAVAVLPRGTGERLRGRREGLRDRVRREEAHAAGHAVRSRGASRGG